MIIRSENGCICLFKSLHLCLAHGRSRELPFGPRDQRQGASEGNMCSCNHPARIVKSLELSNFFEVQPNPENMQRCDQPVTIKRMINFQVLDQRVLLLSPVSHHPINNIEKHHTTQMSVTPQFTQSKTGASNKPQAPPPPPFLRRTSVVNPTHAGRGTDD